MLTVAKGSLAVDFLSFPRAAHGNEELSSSRDFHPSAVERYVGLQNEVGAIAGKKSDHLGSEREYDLSTPWVEL